MCIIISFVPAQQIHNDEGQEAFKDSGYFSKISDKSIGDFFLLFLHTSLIETKPSLFLLSIETSS